MNFKIGDKVAVLDDVFKGKVIGFKGEKIAVETTDGFSFEFSANELVLVNEDQFELSKYRDISNESLIEKETETGKKASPKFKSDSKKKRMPPLEVDLHINQLTSSSKGLDNYDMLNIQLDTAKQKLEFAIRNKIQKVIFIHGVGEGVLKMELEYLFKKYPVEWYAASFQKYGLGATEVYIFQNSK